ncbi:transglycosylase SLT domain-containing protein [Streptomyces sp. NPDC045456]|uniref:transglycosylase SLT domain-containing protein n=1 Tax=Streptomyces sp. NPDC045456 TaxID=3155254 RepID=UPI0033E5242E
MATGGVLVGRGYVAIRPEFQGNWNRTLRDQATGAGQAFAGQFSKVLKSAAAPIAAVGATIGATLVTSVAAAGAGAGAFVAAVKPQLTKVTEASELYTKAQEAQAEGGKKAAEAQKAYTQALAAMPPATRKTATAFIGLKKDFTAWSDSLSGTTMPLFTRGINLLRAALPKLTPFVKSTAVAFTGFLDSLGKGQAGRVFTEFGANMRRLSGSSLASFLNILRNIAVGFVGVLNAFAPMSRGVTGGLEQMTARFAAFGATLRTSAGFQQFIAYVRANAPQAQGLVANLARTAVTLIQAIAPLGGVTLQVVTIFAQLTAAIPTPVMRLLVNVLAATVVAAKLYAVYVTAAAAVTRGWAVAQGILNRVMALNPILRVVLIVIALGTALVLAYRHSTTFRTVVQAAWQGIQTAASWAWNNVLKPVFTGIAAAGRVVGQVAMWLWNNAIGPAFRFIGAAARILLGIVAVAVFGPLVVAFNVVAAVARALWTAAIRPAFNAIAAIAKWLWNTIVRPTLLAMQAGFRALGAVARWLYDNIVKPVFNGIRTVIAAWWASAKLIFAAVRAYVLGPLGSVFRWLYDNIVKPVWNGIKAAISAVWNYGIKPVFNAVRSAVRAVGDAFSAAKDAIGRAWDKLRDITRKPVQFIIDTVYNNGIRKVWNTVVGAFGGKELGVVRFADGGVLPGYTPGRDVHLAALSGGEAVMRPEWTRAVGPGYVHAMNAAARGGGVSGVQRALGLPGFADGGIFSGIGTFVSGAWDKLKKGAKWLADTFGGAIKNGIKSLINPVIDLIPGEGGFPGLLKGGMRRLVEKLLGAGEKGDKLAVPNIKYNPSAGVEQWRGVASAVLRELGVFSPYNLTAVLQTIRKESGGNPRAINLWDSNARAGTPSKGLIQTIDPTFNAYAGKYRNRGPYDPYANIYAGIRYARSRYGSGWAARMARPGGYDSGGWLMPGLSATYNGTGRPEAVLTGSQWDAMSAAVARGEEPVVVEVHTKDDALAGFIDVRVRRGQQQLTSVLRAGRR